MTPEAQHLSPEVLAVGDAIEDAEKIAREHERSAQLVAWTMGLFIVFLVLIGVGTHWMQSRTADRVVSNFNAAANTIKSISLSASAPPGQDKPQVQITTLLDRTKASVDAIAENAKTSGLQNSLLLAGAAFLALVFALSMSVYRHHLSEISKLQHARLAFTRVRIAMRGQSSGERASRIQQTLLDRAFEYRSGKEKQVESPVPGHPVADTSAAIADHVVEALSKRQP